MPRRLALTGLYQASVLDYKDRALKPDEVLVRTEFASGKHGTTLAMLDGRSFAGMRFDSERHLFVDSGEPGAIRRPSRANPWRTGTSGLGLVEAVGEDVTRLSPGDRVVGLMDIRETNICAEDRVWPLGDIDPLVALCIEPAYVSIHCIRESNIRYGDRVAVIGLGALGLLAVSIAREAGAETIVAADLLPQRRALALEYGADHAFDPRDGDLASQTHELTDGMGVDVAIELTGAYIGLNTAIACTRVGGLVCSAGFYQGEAQDLFLGREWHHNRLTMIVPHGCGFGHEPRDYPYWDSQRAFRAILSMMRQGRLNCRGLINRVYPLEEATQVFEHIRQQPDALIKFAVDLRG
ncbi:MAG: zinc-binding alcohol dehydrogenase [Chloroflexi bacterium]|nr:zinc-binding alcohol dehydrogenase [Chloroflexota bacterium]